MTVIAYSIEKPSTSTLEQQAETLNSFAPYIAKALKLAINDIGLLSPFHAKTASGTYLYHETLRYMRELLKEYGFEPLNMGNVELTYHKQLGIALYYCRVTKEVKSLDSYPLSLRKRGEHTKKLMHLSENSLLTPDLFPETLESVENNSLVPFMHIWAVMLYADVKTEQYVANIGYPESVDHHSRIDSFSHRIPLPLDISDIVTEKRPDFAENPETEIQTKYEKLIA